MMPDKSSTALKTIGEVSEELGVATHVLRFWETKFKQIKPQKRRGRRYYHPEDVVVITQIKALLYGQGYTIRGVQKFFTTAAKLKPEGNLLEEKIAAPEQVKYSFNTDLFGNPLANSNEESPAENPLKADDIAKLKEIHTGLLALRDKIKNFGMTS